MRAAHGGRRATLVRLVLTGVLVAGGAALVLPNGSSSASSEPVVAPTPQKACNAGSRPETSIQGRVPKRDYDSGRARRGYTCNTSFVSHIGASGGFKRGDILDIAGPDGRVVARGLSEYPAADIAAILGLGRDAQEATLGYAPRSAVVHRDHLVLL